MDNSKSDKRGRQGVYHAVIAGSLIALALLLLNFEHVFRTRIVEDSDFAANAIQIEYAKSGDARYGNYSRWGFNHPGPFFWYYFAANEYVLRDALHIVQSPRGAHIVATILFQVGCVSLSLLIVVRGSGRPDLLPVGFAVTAVYFSIINREWAAASTASTWPPHLLLGPFVLFICSCSLLGSGIWRALPLTVFAGSVLVHGHVSQPLFVGPLFIAAVVTAWAGRRRPDFERPRLLDLCLAASVAIVMIAPMVIDAFSPGETNLDRIGKHLAAHPERQSIGDAVGYVAAMLAHASEPGSEPPVAFVAGGRGWEVLWTGHRWTLLAVAVALAAILESFTASLREPWVGSTSAGVARFRLSLSLQILLAVALAVEWARRQSGPMYQFNSFFLFGLVPLSACLLFDRVFSGTSRARIMAHPGLVWGACSLLAVYAFAGREWRLPQARLDTGFESLRAHAASTPETALLFAQEDWPNAVQAALVLMRSGAQFKVPRPWDVMFGGRSALANGDYAHEKLHVIRPGASPSGVYLPGGYELAELTPPALSPNGTTVTFSATGNAAQFLQYGFGHPESDRVWTVAEYAALLFKPEPAHAPVSATLDLEPFVVPPRLPEQHLTVTVGGEVVSDVSIAGRTRLVFEIPLHIWNNASALQMEIRVSTPRSPASFGLGGDNRLLGLSLFELHLDHVASRGLPHDGSEP